EVRFAEVEQMRSAAGGLAPPRREGTRVEDVRGDTGVVEGEDRFVAGEDIAPALPFLDLLQTAAQVVVAAQERRCALVGSRPEVTGGVPLALDEGVADEQLPRQRPIDAGQLHAAPGDDVDAEQR